MPSNVPICTATNPCLLLLVEDNAEYVRLFETELAEARENRFRVMHAPSLYEMERLIGIGGHVDAVILDPGLNDSNGIETLKRAVRITRHRIPIIVLTGGAEFSDNEALEAGARVLCEKTRINQYGLLRVVHEAIARQRVIDDILDEVESQQRQAKQSGESAGLRAIENLKSGIMRLLPER